MVELNKSEKRHILCERCSKPFPSKNALFRHLKSSIGSSNSCLTPEEIPEFMAKVINRKDRFEKIAILYGYILSDYYLQRDLHIQTDDGKGWGLKDGDHAAQLLTEAAQEVSLGAKVETQDEFKANRSYGCNSRSKDIQGQLCQDKNTGALTEVLCMRLPPLFYNEGDNEEDKTKNEKEANDKWVEALNSKLVDKILELNDDKESHRHLGKIQVFGRLTVLKKFNAEMDVSHRRVDYLLPADLLYGPTVKEIGHSFEQFCGHMISFNRGQTVDQSNEHGLLTYLHKLKKLMQAFCTQIVDVEVRDGEEKKDQDEGNHEECKTSLSNESAQVKPTTTMRKKAMRRRYHNFTPRMMAHEYLSYRRLDRFYHRGTIRANEFQSNNIDISLKKRGNRPFFILSLKGDLFLNGLSRSMVGLFIAIVLGYIDEEIIECVFNEEYTNLVPAPSVPSCGQFSAEAWYISWEGKLNYILCPRNCNDYGGWNTKDVLSQLDVFQEEMYSSIMREWYCCDKENVVDVNQQLLSCTNWINHYLVPWSKEANQELQYYRKWKEAKRVVQESNSSSLTIASALLPPLESISLTIPKLYATVLHHLQEIDASNLWPSTTPKRQLVMVSTSEGTNDYECLVASHIKAQSNNPERESAYSFREGEGGASGSFSVGAMPGSQCEQPKGNKLFPELMKAAFELEIALCPDREPSSTIAINRNAQFRPHLDNGAGAGQSRSLIVGLGTYVGGELMVEGKQHYIRYKPLEFNGWTERHWTLPFRGERYSLVWFTPKGCEGVRGIDLCI